jgi:hypothetical protein
VCGGYLSLDAGCVCHSALYCMIGRGSGHAAGAIFKVDLSFDPLQDY